MKQVNKKNVQPISYVTKVDIIVVVGVEHNTPEEIQIFLQLASRKVVTFRSAYAEIAGEDLGEMKKKGMVTIPSTRTLVSVGRSPHGHKTAMDQFDVTKKGAKKRIPVRSLYRPQGVHYDSFVRLMQDFVENQPVVIDSITQTMEESTGEVMLEINKEGDS